MLIMFVIEVRFLLYNYGEDYGEKVKTFECKKAHAPIVRKFEKSLQKTNI